MSPGTLATLAVLSALTFGLTGCTGSSQDDSTPAPTTAETAAPTPTAAPTLPKGVTAAPIPTEVPNEPKVRQNVVLSGCSATDGGWQATGTATNPGKDSVTYEITVFFTTTSATTLNSAKTQVDVDAGKTEKWTAKKSFTAPKEMLCVLRGVASD